MRVVVSGDLPFHTVVVNVGKRKETFPKRILQEPRTGRRLKIDVETCSSFVWGDVCTDITLYSAEQQVASGRWQQRPGFGQSVSSSWRSMKSTM